MNRVFKNTEKIKVSDYSVYSTEVEEADGKDVRHIVVVQTPIGEFGYISSSNLGKRSYLQIPKCAVKSIYPYFEHNRDFRFYVAKTKNAELAILDLVRTPARSGVASKDLADKIAIVGFHLDDARWSDEI